jgi:Tfp pilus assembly protein PilO
MNSNSRINQAYYSGHFAKVKQIYQEPKTKISLALILTLLTFSLIISFAIKPAILTIISLHKELKESQKVNEALTNKLQNLTQAQQNFIALQQDLIYVDRALPKTAEFNRLAREINYLAYYNNVILASGNFGKFDLLPVPSQQPAELSLNFAINGSFADIKNFVADLNNISRLVNIEGITFNNKSTANDNKNIIYAELKGNAYWLPERSAVGKKS